MNFTISAVWLRKKKRQLTTGVVGLLLAGQDVGKSGLLLSLVQYIVPVGRQKCAAMKVHYIHRRTNNEGLIDYFSARHNIL